MVARIVMLAVAAAALPAPNGPTSDGTANQRPWVTGVVARPSGNPAVAVVPDVLSSSGSPGNGPKSNITARSDVAVADTLWVMVGTIHSGGSAEAASGSLSPATASCGASV